MPAQKAVTRPTGPAPMIVMSLISSFTVRREPSPADDEMHVKIGVSESV